MRDNGQVFAKDKYDACKFLKIPVSSFCVRCARDNDIPIGYTQKDRLANTPLIRNVNAMKSFIHQLGR